MAKRKVAKKSRARSSVQKSNNIFGMKYDSLTFLLFLVFVLVVGMVLVSKMLGMGGY